MHTFMNASKTMYAKLVKKMYSDYIYKWLYINSVVKFFLPKIFLVLIINASGSFIYTYYM